MAFVLVDNEAFKITLQIIEDFISKDYDAFIENEPTDDIKLITWEMEIYFKKLEGKENSIVKYYIISIYKVFKGYMYSYFNGQFGYVERIDNKARDACFREIKSYNTLTIDFEKNILSKTITIKFICDEIYETNYSVWTGSYTNFYKYYYLKQLEYIINKLVGRDSLLSNELYIHNYYKKDDKINEDKKINFPCVCTEHLKNKIKTHYQEILKNIEAYVLYCKTEKIDIDFKKIVDRITFIKQYVKDIYDITLI